MPSSPQIFVTADCSQSLQLPGTEITYHSRHGAVQESRHIFIEAGLDFVASAFAGPLNILEIGFGTGLNALLAAIYSQNLNREINYISYEKFPLAPKIYNLLDYSEFVGGHRSLFLKLHESPWAASTKIMSGFTFCKLQEDVTAIQFPFNIHLVYFDAFAPSATPELWEKPVFEKLFECMKPGAVLVTFCAKGEVKRTLKSCGFIVETLPGPPGKREMTRASRSF